MLPTKWGCVGWSDLRLRFRNVLCLWPQKGRKSTETISQTRTLSGHKHSLLYHFLIVIISWNVNFKLQFCQYLSHTDSIQSIVIINVVRVLSGSSRGMVELFVVGRLLLNLSVSPPHLILFFSSSSEFRPSSSSYHHPMCSHVVELLLTSER